MKNIGIVLSLLFFQQILSAQIEIPGADEFQRGVPADTTYTYEWNEENEKWEIYARQLHFHETRELVTSVLEQKWQREEQKWQNHEQTLKYYDEKEQEVQSVLQQWDIYAKDWLNVQMKTTTYDRRGNAQEVLYQEWSRPAGEWINTIIYMISYNIDHEKSDVVIRTFSGMDKVWSNYLRYSYSDRNYSGHPRQVLVESWNKQEESWKTFGQYNLAYNNRGKVIEEIRSTWNTSNDEWIRGLRYLASYRRSNKTEQIEQRWNYNTRSWLNTNRISFLYDEETGEIAEETIYNWDAGDDQWRIKTRFLYTDLRPEEDET